MAITLVTGGTGFIGSCLVDTLLREKRQVRILVKPTPIDEIEKDNLKRFKQNNLDLVYSDLRDKNSIIPALDDVDTVFHLAAISPSDEHTKGSIL